MMKFDEFELFPSAFFIHYSIFCGSLLKFSEESREAARILV